MFSKWSTSTICKSWLFKCTCGINLLSFNKNLLMILFILNKSFEILKLWSSLFLIKVSGFLPQRAQFDKSIILFSLGFLTLESSYAVCNITDPICFHCFYIIYSTEVSGIFISSFISLYSHNTLFAETNLSWLLYVSIKTLETTISIAFILDFHNSTISSFFFIIDLYFFNSCSDCKNF